MPRYPHCKFPGHVPGGDRWRLRLAGSTLLQTNAFIRAAEFLAYWVDVFHIETRPAAQEQQGRSSSDGVVRKREIAARNNPFSRGQRLGDDCTVGWSRSHRLRQGRT